MLKFKVFMPCGTIQTIMASNFAVDWPNGGVLRFTLDDRLIAVFPPGGWHGVQNMEVYKKEVV